MLLKIWGGSEVGVFWDWFSAENEVKDIYTMSTIPDPLKLFSVHFLHKNNPKNDKSQTGIKFYRPQKWLL